MKKKGRDFWREENTKTWKGEKGRNEGTFGRRETRRTGMKGEKRRGMWGLKRERKEK